MKKSINTRTINDLKFFKNKMLMHRDRMFYIKDFKIETEKIKVRTGMFTRKEVEKQFLTALDIVTYFDNYKTLGTMQNDDAYRVILFYDITGLRENWLSFKRQLKFFGVINDKDEK